jgi:hypothetical protein
VEYTADCHEVAIPGLEALLTDRLGGFFVLVQEFKFDFNAYLARYPTIPVRSLEQVLASGTYHPALEEGLHNSQNTASLDTKEYLEHLVKRSTLKQAILQAMAEHRFDALAYPTIRRKAAPVGERQLGSNCHLSANSGSRRSVCLPGSPPMVCPSAWSCWGVRGASPCCSSSPTPMSRLPSIAGRRRPRRRSRQAGANDQSRQIRRHRT